MADSSDATGKKTRCNRQAWLLGRLLSAPCTRPNLRVALWLFVSVFQFLLIRYLFEARVPLRRVALSAANLRSWNASCSGSIAEALAAARRGEIVDVGGHSEGSRYFIVPRVCVSKYERGWPWLPASALSEAGLAQLAALDPRSEGSLPGVLSALGDGADEAQVFRLPVRAGSAVDIAAVDGGAPAPVLGSPSEVPAVVVSVGSGGGDAFSPSAYSLAGSWLRLGGLLSATAEAQLSPQLLSPFGSQELASGSSPVGALFAAPPPPASSPKCFGPAIVGARVACDATAKGDCSRLVLPPEHALLREAALAHAAALGRGSHLRADSVVRGARAGPGRSALRVVLAQVDAPAAAPRTADFFATVAAVNVSGGSGLGSVVQPARHLRPI